ncbi:MAG: FHA domain-containing protein [Nitrospirae bacterium]|nr:FHA domain-containing protein [Nitrospirota bacterium]MBI3593829.1 FHA domain-containing protein [Nitrospirota bacterium]
MLDIHIPVIKTYFEKKRYSTPFVNTLFKKLHEKREERIDLMVGESQSKTTYLVALEGSPLGAFYIEENTFRTLGGRDYFNLLQGLPDLMLSYYAVDPVFAKCLLTPSQNKPAYKGSIQEKDLKKKIETIQNDPGENMILLHTPGGVSFFYFKSGRGIASYFFQPEQKPDECDIGNQFLVYVLSQDISLLTMEVYHNAKITPLLLNRLTPEEVSGGIVEYFQKQKPKLMTAEKLDFELDLTPPSVTAVAPDVGPPVGEELSTGRLAKAKWYLELVGGEQMGRRVVLNKPQLTIGRMKADMMLGDVKISRQHATIELTDQGYRFTDLGSTNGSFINGQQVKTQFLKAGDIIRVGGTLIKFVKE